MESEIGIHRIHKFTYQDTEVVNAAFDHSTASGLRIEARLLTTYLTHIHDDSKEVQISASPDIFRVLSYHSAQADLPLGSVVNKRMVTEMTIATSEFDMYDYREEGATTDLVFCLKELKGLLNLCEHSDPLLTDVTLHYTSGGAPIKFECENDSLSMHLIMATLMSPSDVSESQARHVGAAASTHHTHATRTTTPTPSAPASAPTHVPMSMSQGSAVMSQQPSFRALQPTATAPSQEEHEWPGGDRDRDGSAAPVARKHMDSQSQDADTYDSFAFQRPTSTSSGNGNAVAAFNFVSSSQSQSQVVVPMGGSSQKRGRHIQEEETDSD